MYSLSLWSGIGIVIGCSPDPISTNNDSDSSSCFSSDPQSLTWERLGSPIGFEERVPVAPSLVVVDGELWMYYSLREGLRDSVYLVRSLDGFHWSEPISVTGFDDETEIKHFHVANTGGEFHAFLGGGSITELQSSDGIHWAIDAQRVVPTEFFDQWGQSYPVSDVDGKRIWFSGFDGTTYSIGLAVSNEGIWENQGPVLEPLEDSRYENTAIAQSSLITIGDEHHLWYGGYDTSQTNPGPWRILKAVSEDGVHWSRQGLPLDLTENGEEAYSVREPAVVIWGQQLWMAYISMGDESVYRLRMARCSQ